MAFQIKNGWLRRYEEEPGETKAVIPEDAAVIGGEYCTAFQQCTSLTEITIPAGVYEIDCDAFIGCRALTRLTVSPENKKFRTIDGAVFSKDGKKLVICPPGKTVLTLPATAEEIGGMSLFYCTNLTEINAAPGNTHFRSIGGVLYSADGSRVVYCPKGLSAVRVAEGVTEIEKCAFSSHGKLKSVTLPAGLKKIGGSAFGNCGSLESIIIPAGVEEIGCAAFFECEKMHTLVIPESVTNIGYKAFALCRGLKSVKMHPADSDFPQDYKAVQELTECICAALEMLRTGDFSAEVDKRLKYPVLLREYLRTGDKKLAGYIRENILPDIREHLMDVMRPCICSGDTDFIRFIAGETDLLSPQNIDDLILLAQNEKQHAITALLLDYKHRHFGFAPHNEPL